MEFRILMSKFLFILLIILFASCTKEVQIDIPGYEEQLVIDGQIETDLPAIVLISNTNDIYQGTNIQNYLNSFVSGATVTISDGIITDTLLEVCTDNLPSGTEDVVAGLFGLPVEEIANLQLCFYVSTQITGEPGKSYSLEVLVNEKSYTAQTSILNPIGLDSTYWIEDNDNPGYGFSWANLSDPLETGNAYRWEVKYKDSATFSKPFGPYFDDRFFNGLSFEFAYENPMSFNDPNVSEDARGYYSLNDTIVIKFSTLGEREFQFYDKKYNQIYSAGNPFATPVNIPTNIDGGALGVWAGFSPVYDTLICN